MEERVQKKILPETQAVRSEPAPGPPKQPIIQDSKVLGRQKIHDPAVCSTVLELWKTVAERGARVCGAAGLAGKEVALSSSSDTTCTAPVSATAEAASLAFQGCQPPAAPSATGAHRGCHQWQTTQSASATTRLAVPAWHVVGWRRDAQLVPDCISCSRLPHQTAHNKPVWNTCRSAQLQSQLSVCSFCY